MPHEPARTMSDSAVIKANQKLLVHGDDTEVVCEDHGVTVRWGDLDPIAQLAVLSGLDTIGPDCIMRKVAHDQP